MALRVSTTAPRQVDGVQDRGTVLGDVQQALIGLSASRAEAARLDFAHHLLGGEIVSLISPGYS